MIDKQKTVDIIRSILDHPQWDAPYLYELIRELIKNDSSYSYSFTTNTAYILNMYFHSRSSESAVDGDAYNFIKHIHDSGINGFIKVTFEVVRDGNQ